MDRKGSTVSVTFHKLTPYKKEGVQGPFGELVYPLFL
nr:MAG TPA: hypothetical protein [Caudoviricetes sp.]DAL14699.1 MAG TPA_asm: hypothetical protein [Caudoviricetes sp.]DAO38527.1 MAG TPA: hypothetical protein [Bacteriophage sp.]DAU49813.1 MAG TPA: hypothetical protein [Caudoviricetes sp.]